MNDTCNGKQVGYRGSHLGKGSAYHEQFFDNSYLAHVFRVEQDILKRVIKECFGANPIHHLDFACGTGRILHFLNQFTSSSYGVDISGSMLEVAKQFVDGSCLYCCDLTKERIFEDQSFNLITAFRFFPNAEDSLRMDAMNTLARLLRLDGYIVFNNHLCANNLNIQIARALFSKKYRMMRTGDVVSLLTACNLSLVKVHYASMFPLPKSCSGIRLRAILAFERLFLTMPLVRILASDHVYVCRSSLRCDP